MNEQEIRQQGIPKGNPASLSGLGHDVTNQVRGNRGAVPSTAAKQVSAPALESLETIEQESQAATTKATTFYIEGIGDINELAAVTPDEDAKDEGEGPFVGILHNNVTGIDGIYKQAAICRLSKLCPSWGKDKNLAAREIKRLFDLDAIRQATDVEVKVGFLALDEEGRFNMERQARLALQEQLDDYKRSLAQTGKNEALTIDPEAKGF